MGKRDERGYWVMKCPVLTTGHLTGDVAAGLTEVLPGEDFHGLDVMIGAFGAMVRCVDEEEVLKSVPACLRTALAWAIAEGFDWVRFDAEGDQIGDLTVYEH